MPSKKKGGRKKRRPATIKNAGGYRYGAERKKSSSSRSSKRRSFMTPNFSGRREGGGWSLLGWRKKIKRALLSLGPAGMKKKGTQF